VRGWFKRLHKTPICLIVGIAICEDVEIKRETDLKVEHEAHLELCLGTVLLAAGVPNPLGDALDPSAKVSNQVRERLSVQSKERQKKHFRS
jgi:hypothetical protein